MRFPRFEKKKFFFNFGLKGIIEKCANCFIVYLFLRFFLIKKGVKKCGGCGNFKNALLQKSIIIMKRYYREFGVLYKNVKIYRIPFLKCFNS